MGRMRANNEDEQRVRYSSATGFDFEPLPTGDVLFMQNEMPAKIKSGEAINMKPENPEPPTTGATVWECGPAAKEANHE